MKSPESSLADSKEICVQDKEQKIAVIGPSGSGKTSMIRQILGAEFLNEMKSTTCYEIHKKILVVDDKELEVRFWDCGSNHHQSYPDVIKAFYRNSICVLIVLDSTYHDPTVFEDLVEECHQNEMYNIYVILNKADLLEEQSILSAQYQQNTMIPLNDIPSTESPLRIKEFYQQSGFKFYFGSARQETQSTLPYKDLLTQLIRQNTFASYNSRFQSDKAMVSQFKKLRDSNEIMIPQQPQQQQKKCLIF